MTLAQGCVHTKIQNGFLAHLSQRLIGELKGYSWSGVSPSAFGAHNAQRSSSPKPLCQSKPKFYVEPPWVGVSIFCSRHLGHMTKMAATPIYGKKHSNHFFSRTGRPISMKLGTALPIKAKFYVEPPWVGGTIFCLRHLGHMTKMVARPYMVKTI